MIFSGKIIDFTNTPIRSKTLVFTSLNSPGPSVSASLIGTADSVSITSSVDGQVSSSLIDGIRYSVELEKPTPESVFYLNNSGSVISASVVTGSLCAVTFDFDKINFDEFADKQIVITPELSYPVLFSGSLVMLAASSSRTNDNGIIVVNC